MLVIPGSLLVVPEAVLWECQTSRFMALMHYRMILDFSLLSDTLMAGTFSRLGQDWRSLFLFSSPEAEPPPCDHSFQPQLLRVFSLAFVHLFLLPVVLLPSSLCSCF